MGVKLLHLLSVPNSILCTETLKLDLRYTVNTVRMEKKRKCFINKNLILDDIKKIYISYLQLLGYTLEKLMKPCPLKWFGSAVCKNIYITIYPSAHKQLIRTILEARPVFEHSKGLLSYLILFISKKLSLENDFRITFTLTFNSFHHMYML